MAKTIVIASGKGGTGKTLVSINFALALNYLNHKVCLIDGNIKKPNIMHHLKMPKKHTIHDICKKNSDPMDTLHWHPSGMQVIFGSNKIDDLDNIDYEKFSKFLSFMKRKLKHDFIILDSAPNYSSEFFYSANVADETIIVTHSDHISIDDAKKTISLAEDEGSSVVGVIVNGFAEKNRKIDISKIEQELRRPILGMIPHDNSVKKSIKMGHPVVCSFPASKISKSFVEIGKRFSGLNEKY